MSDFIQVTPGSGDYVAGDRIGGQLYQRIKLSVGADGSARDLSSIEQPIIPNGTQSGQTLTVSNVAVQFSAFNAGTEYIMFDIQDSNVRFTLDDSDPTSSKGHLLYKGTYCQWTLEMAQAAKFIRVSNVDAIIYASQCISR